VLVRFYIAAINEDPFQRARFCGLSL
jgi:hypothetical protein